MSESLYKAALLNLTSELRFLLKKCGLQCRVTSGTCDNTLDRTLPRLQKASRVQFSRTDLCSFMIPLCWVVILKLGNPCSLFEMCWDMESFANPCSQGLTSCVLGSACNHLLLPTFSLNVSWALSGLFQGPAWQRYQESIAGVLQERSWRRWSMNSGVLVVRIC